MIHSHLKLIHIRAALALAAQHLTHTTQHQHTPDPANAPALYTHCHRTSLLSFRHALTL